MACNCNCNITNPYFHKSTSLQLIPAGDDTSAYVSISVNNSTNIASLDYFELVLTINPDTVVTEGPVQFKINVNGTDVALLNRYSLPVNTNRLNVRKRYFGAYVVPPTGDPYVILWNTPSSPMYAE